MIPIFGIDDTLYREHQFYPKDLFDFAQILSKPVNLSPKPVNLAVKLVR